jgi:DNA-binding protein H-NS
MKSLDRMSLSELIKAKADVEIAIFARMNEVKVSRRAATSKRRASFRNPKNPDETWGGRGRRPFWLIAALKRGKKLSDFAIH